MNLPPFGLTEKKDTRPFQMIRSCTAASFFSVDYIFSPKNVTLTLSRITTVGVTFRRHYFLLRFFFSGDEETLGHHLEKTRVSVCFSSRLSKAWKTSILSINKCLETDTWYSKWPKMLKQVKNGKRWFCQISKMGLFQVLLGWMDASTRNPIQLWTDDPRKLKGRMNSLSVTTYHHISFAFGKISIAENGSTDIW